MVGPGGARERAAADRSGPGCPNPFVKSAGRFRGRVQPFLGVYRCTPDTPTFFYLFITNDLKFTVSTAWGSCRIGGNFPHNRQRSAGWPVARLSRHQSPFPAMIALP